MYGRIDNFAEDCKLHYLRTKDGLEVDFAMVKDNEIEEIIEVKESSTEISKSLYDFHKKYQFSAVQVVQHLRLERKVGQIELLRAENFLKKLFL